MTRTELTAAALPRPVEVLVDDGAWVDGWLESYRSDAVTWFARVHLSSAPAAPSEWVEGRRIRAKARGRYAAG